MVKAYTDIRVFWGLLVGSFVHSFMYSRKFSRHKQSQLIFDKGTKVIMEKGQPFQKMVLDIYMESKEKKKGHEEPSGKTGIKTQTY